MRGRRPGRPTKWLKATVEESLYLDRTGIQFEVWTKWKKTDKKLGTLIVSVGGLRWLPGSGKKVRRKSWDAAREWFETPS